MARTTFKTLTDAADHLSAKTDIAYRVIQGAPQAKGQRRLYALVVVGDKGSTSYVAGTEDRNGHFYRISIDLLISIRRMNAEASDFRWLHPYTDPDGTNAFA